MIDRQETQDNLLDTKNLAACVACGRGSAQQAPANVSAMMEEGGDKELEKGSFVAVVEAAGTLALAEDAALPPGKRRHKSVSTIKPSRCAACPWRRRSRIAGEQLWNPLYVR